MKRFTTALACCLLCGHVRAADLPAGDVDLPQPFDENTVTPLIQNSPFIRSVSLSDSLILTGLAYIESKPVATIMNTETHQNYAVSSDPNAMGWKLTEATATTDISRAQVKIAIGGEVVVIRYNKEAMSPENLKKNRGRMAGSSSGGDSDRYRRSDSRTSDEDRQKYESLSEAGKEKLKTFFRENMDKLRTAGNDEERRQFIRNAFEKIEKEEKGGK